MRRKIRCFKDIYLLLLKNVTNIPVFARKLLHNPFFPLQAAQQLGDEIEWAVQNARAKPFTQKN